MLVPDILDAIIIKELKKSISFCSFCQKKTSKLYSQQGMGFNYIFLCSKACLVSYRLKKKIIKI